MTIIIRYAHTGTTRVYTGITQVCANRLISLISHCQDEVGEIDVAITVKG